MITKVKNKYSKIVSDYLLRDEKLSDFYKYEVGIENFEQVVLDKKKDEVNREILVEILEKQNSKIEISDVVKNNIASLKEENTFTICTAHQPCLFSGPLYFIYKIISAINLSEELNEKYSQYHFVPIFWMGSEDHDFEEINHIHLFNKKLEWETNQKGAVGRMKLDEINPIIDELEIILGEHDNAKKIVNLLRNCYNKNNILSEATRAFVNELMGEYGLVILDGDEKGLKEQFIPVMQDELQKQSANRIVEETINSLAKDYKVQVKPREINLFYLSENTRERIVINGSGFKTLDNKTKWTNEGILKELTSSPERFSPNVILRPLYQETVLPNLSYIGGAGELAYWLELKTLFDYHNINYPMLMLRNSVLWIDASQQKKIEQLGLSEEDLILSQDEIIKNYISKQDSAKVDFSKEKAGLSQLFDEIAQKAIAIDSTLEPFVNAEKAKQANTINKIEEKLSKANKRKHEEAISKIEKLKSKLFPNNMPQERFENIISLLFKHDREALILLKEQLQPFDNRLLVISK